MKINCKFTHDEHEMLDRVMRAKSSLSQLTNILDECEQKFKSQSVDKIILFLTDWSLRSNNHELCELLASKFLKKDYKIVNNELIYNILNETKISSVKTLLMRKLFLNHDMIENEKQFFEHYIYKNCKNFKADFYHDYEKIDKSNFILYYLSHTTIEQKDYFFNQVSKMKLPAKTHVYGLLISKGMLNEQSYRNLKETFDINDLDYLLEDFVCFEKNTKYLDIFKDEIKAKFKNKTFKLGKVGKLLTDNEDHFNYIWNNFILESDYQPYFINQTFIRAGNRSEKSSINKFLNFILQRDTQDSSLSHESIFIIMNRLAYAGERQLLEKLFLHVQKNKSDFFPNFQQALFKHEKFNIETLNTSIKINFDQPVIVEFSKWCFNQYLNKKVPENAIPKPVKSKI